MSVDHEVQHDVNFQDVSILLKMGESFQGRDDKDESIILGRLLKVDKEMLKVLLKAPTETISGMNVVISRCRGGWAPPYKGYLGGEG